MFSSRPDYDEQGFSGVSQIGVQVDLSEGAAINTFNDVHLAALSLFEKNSRRSIISASDIRRSCKTLMICS